MKNMVNITIKNPNEIKSILNVIHDCWFNINDVIFDSTGGILTIKFSREMIDKKEIIGKRWFLKRIKTPIVECILKIYNVKDYSISDKAHVETYDFNELNYDPKSKQIHISTGFPVDIEIMVDDFEVSVEETGKVLKEKLSLSL